MKKKILATLAAAMLCAAALALTACCTEEPSEPLDLTGTWVQTNSNSDSMYVKAEIADDAITVNWVMTDDDSESLYWAGTYEAPTAPEDTWTWTSQNDKAQTDMALLASGDDTKEFSYANGQLSYEGSMMGEDFTVTMERAE